MVLLIAIVLLSPLNLAAQDAITPNFPRVNWQPTQAPRGARYVGDRVCATCHASEAATQKLTGMAKALERVSDCAILQRHPDLRIRLGRFTYRIVTRGNRSVYTVTDGTSVFSEPIQWAFGQGQAGQTYVYKVDGNYYESRVSFFNDTQKLDLTMGYSNTRPGNIQEAAGRRISPDEARDCLACHSTASVSAGHLQLDRLMPGVTCEGCHGPGAKHVAAVKASETKTLDIFDPGSLDSQDLSDFCGSCHRSWQQVEMMHLQGIVDVRFQPYRLTSSRCFDPSDRRISCTACHNPHQQVRTDPAFYDSKCVACHLRRGESARRVDNAGDSPARTCPVSIRNCVTCHMPKYTLPGAHYKFTDHYIRVVRAGERYPY
jgi:hypothetical protein